MGLRGAHQPSNEDPDSVCYTLVQPVTDDELAWQTPESLTNRSIAPALRTCPACSLHRQASTLSAATQLLDRFSTPSCSPRSGPSACDLQPLAEGQEQVPTGDCPSQPPNAGGSPSQPLSLPPSTAKQAPPSPQQHISPPSLLAEQATMQDPAAAGAGSAARSPAAGAPAVGVRVMPQGVTSQPGEDAAAAPSPQAGGPDAHCLILPPHPSAIPDLASPPPDPPGTPSPPGSPLGPLPPLPILRKPALPSSVFRAAHHGSGPLPPGLAASPPQKVVQSGRLADAWGKGGGVGCQDSLDITAQRWSWAWRQVRTLLSVSQGFRTLRDQYQDQEIHSSELQVLKVLGEGAFARVELCLFTPSPEAQAARTAAQLSNTPASPLPTEGAPPASLPPQPLHTASQRRASAPALPTSTPEGGAGLQGAGLPAPPPIVTGAACAADARDLDPWLAAPGQVPEVAASPPPRSVTSGGKHHSVAWASVHGMAAATDREEGPSAPGQLDRADSRMQSSSRRSAPSTRTSSRASRASADAVSRPRTVAVKRLKADVCGSSPAEVAAFMAEVALLRKLKHKHIVQYIGWGQGVPLTPSSLLVTTTGTRPTTPPGTPARVTNQQPDGPGAGLGGQGVGVRGGGEGGPLPGNSLFLVEEVLGGGTLKHLVVQQMKQACQTYRFVDALRWSHQVAAGLAYLHSRHPQIIHRDLKLENILLTDSDPQVAAAKISDFGLVALVAKSLLGERARHALAKRRSSVERGVGGSSQAAPQQAEEAEDARAHAALNKSFCALITKHARKATAQPDPPAAVTRQRKAKVAPLKSSQTAKLAPASAAASAVKRSAASAPQPARTPRRNTQPQTLKQPPAGQGILPPQPPLPPHPLPATHLQPTPPEQDPAAQPPAPVAPDPPPSPLPCNAPAAGSPPLPAAPPAPHMAVQPASTTPTRPNQALLLLPPPLPPSAPTLPQQERQPQRGHQGPPSPPTPHHHPLHPAPHTDPSSRCQQPIPMRSSRNCFQPPQPPPGHPLQPQPSPQAPAPTPALPPSRPDSITSSTHCPSWLPGPSPAPPEPGPPPHALPQPCPCGAPGKAGWVRQRSQARRLPPPPLACLPENARGGGESLDCSSLGHSQGPGGGPGGGLQGASWQQGGAGGVRDVLHRLGGSVPCSPLSPASLPGCGLPAAGAGGADVPLPPYGGGRAGAGSMPPPLRRFSSTRLLSTPRDVLGLPGAAPPAALPHAASSPGSVPGGGPAGPGRGGGGDPPLTPASEAAARLLAQALARPPARPPDSAAAAAADHMSLSDSHCVPAAGRGPGVGGGPGPEVAPGGAGPGPVAESTGGQGGSVRRTPLTPFTANPSRFAPPTQEAAPPPPLPSHPTHPPPSPSPASGPAAAPAGGGLLPPPSPSPGGGPLAPVRGAGGGGPATGLRLGAAWPSGPDLGQGGGLRGAPGPRVSASSVPHTPAQQQGGSPARASPPSPAPPGQRPQRKQIRNGFSVTDEAARLSGRTGTLVFMAPEVFKSENYNDKADVFSFAVVLYEVFHRFLVVLAAAPDGRQSSVEQYALMVSLGYRPPLGRHLAPGLAHLIRDCWQHSPADRPCMADVAARLEQLERDNSVADMDKVAGPDCAAGCLGCCIT